jgi:hypothetical protein
MSTSTQAYAEILSRGGYLASNERKNPATKVSPQDIDLLSKAGYINGLTKKVSKRSNPSPSVDEADIELLILGGFIRENASKKKSRKSSTGFAQLPQEIKTLEDTAKGEALAEAAISNLSDPKSRIKKIKADSSRPSQLQSFKYDDAFEWFGFKGAMVCIDADHIIPASPSEYDMDFIRGVALAPTHPKTVLPIPMIAPTVDIEVQNSQGFAVLGNAGAVSIGAFLSGATQVCVQISSALHKQYKTWVESGKPSGKNSPLMRFLDRNLF